MTEARDTTIPSSTPDFLYQGAAAVPVKEVKFPVGAQLAKRAGIYLASVENLPNLGIITIQTLGDLQVFCSRQTLTPSLIQEVLVTYPESEGMRTDDVWQETTGSPRSGLSENGLFPAWQVAKTPTGQRINFPQTSDCKKIYYGENKKVIRTEVIEKGGRKPHVEIDQRGNIINGQMAIVVNKRWLNDGDEYLAMQNFEMRTTILPSSATGPFKITAEEIGNPPPTTNPLETVEHDLTDLIKVESTLHRKGENPL